MESVNFPDLIEKTEYEALPFYESRTAGLIRDLLINLGEDPNREGLVRTPERVARMYDELLAGYQMDAVTLVNEAIFESSYQDIVLVRDIEFYSLCEHHMLPFFGHAHVAYIPNGKIIGLSKIPRLVDMYARRLQVQERMTEEIAHSLESILKPKGVAVVVEGAHMCAMMRGVKKSETSMVTKAMLGVFRTDEKIRGELMSHLERGK
jgi:GTP cyclohydrolase I